MESLEDDPIVLPDGTQVPAIPGKYRIEPPPDLNEAADSERRFFLEYDFPFLIVREIALPLGSGNEDAEATCQGVDWKKQNTIGGHVSFSRGGYQFNMPTTSGDGKCYHQLIPSMAYVDERTWSQLSQEEKNTYYLPCVPVVVILLMTMADKMEDLQAKVTSFVDAGTREGVIVDTRRDRVWIYNRNQQPYFDALAPIEFDSWPRFTLDCIAIRDFRTRAGLP